MGMTARRDTVASAARITGHAESESVSWKYSLTCSAVPSWRPSSQPRVVLLSWVPVYATLSGV
jgi:hypothetical protein